MLQKTVLSKKEVIVVLGCVVFCTLNLIAAGGSSRRHAKYVVCQANLKQWGQIFYLFAQDNEDNLPQSVSGNGVSAEDAFWVSATLPYYQDYKTHLCPSTKPSNNLYGSTGGTFVQWGPFPHSSNGSQWYDFVAFGSYGFNEWCSNPPPGSYFWGLPTANTWRTINAEGAYNVPLILDSVFVDTAVQHYDMPPNDMEHQNDTYNANWSYNAMKFFCIDRHNGGINGVFLDSSVRKINPKKLWTLKWHKNFDTDNMWTQPNTSWPSWMQQY